MNNIVLIGMPGSGKSTIGVLLAKALGYSFTDTDLIISRMAEKPLQKILDNDGLEAFLKLEEQTGCRLVCDHTVIATGGSMVLSEKAMQNLTKGATTVFIDVPLDEIKHRVTNITTRGIVFDKGETLDDVYAKRYPLYNKFCDVRVTVANSGIENTVDLIVDKLKITDNDINNPSIL